MQKECRMCWAFWSPACSAHVGSADALRPSWREFSKHTLGRCRPLLFLVLNVSEFGKPLVEKKSCSLLYSDSLKYASGILSFIQPGLTHFGSQEAHHFYVTSVHF